MKYKRIMKLLSKTMDSTKLQKFSTRKWIEIFVQSSGSYNANKDIRFKTPQLRSNLCDFNDAYIVVTSKITATNPDDNVFNRNLALKNSAPFISCILKMDNHLIEDTQDLDVVAPIYNLLYYSKNFRKTTGSFCNHYPDIPKSGYNNNNRDRIFYQIKDSESFSYKTKLVGKLPESEKKSENVKSVVPLKNLSNFMFDLDILLINA